MEFDAIGITLPGAESILYSEAPRDRRPLSREKSRNSQGGDPRPAEWEPADPGKAHK